ncbi:MAG TPA: alpha-galactosidase [Mycobacteriales bacterium]|nr:alpha-galactosidase [Mycobacteriales bacterium]
MTSGDAGGLVHLRAAGASLLLDARGPGPVTVPHWGPDLGELDGSTVDELVAATVPAVPRGTLDLPVPVALLPAYATGDPGRPGLSGSRGGRAFSPLFRSPAVAGRGPGRVVLTATDPDAGLALRTEVELAPAGLLRLRHVLTNTGSEPYQLDGLAAALPIPDRAGELLDFTGHWCRERSPQRHRLAMGSWVRENRAGRTGHDATVGLCAGTPGFGFRAGEVWAVHVAWSGNSVSYAERAPRGVARLGGGELLLPGEVVLAPGQEYATPELCAAYSGAGLDGISAAFHGWLRSRPQHPRSPRPATLNVWEAVYFDHDLDRLVRLADLAAEAGVERFVLDDGWFRHRRDDTAGLGDWYVDETVWPDGLGPLIGHVRDRGMQFGLWVEPEMVNPDSDLFRAHPDWILAVPGRQPVPARHQQVLDLAHPPVSAYLLERLDALLTEHDIGYLKWDHNRDLVDAGRAGPQERGRPGVRTQTLALYALLDELRRRHPGVEIESCASGGARVDLGILQRTDRVWTSDCNDALERQAIQRWTGVFLPPELLGAHVGADRSHTTGRAQTLSFRAVTALFGHQGLEWDLAAATGDERAAVAAWLAFVRDWRAVLHGGTVVRADRADESAWLHGVVGSDRALYAFVQLATSALAGPEPARLPGLDPDRRYAVRPAYPAGAPEPAGQALPAWLAAGGVELPGRVLAAVGLPMPVLHPEEAFLLTVTRT